MAKPTVETIILSRGSNGLGFNIRGGIDMPHIQGDTGIFVTKLREDGTAYADGRLQEGDKILKVNDKSLERITHQEAVVCFVNAEEPVKMVVQHGAEDDLNQKLNDITKTSNASGSTEGGGGFALFAISTLLLTVGVASVYFYYKRFR